MAKPKRPRFFRRQSAKKAQRLSRDRQKLALLEPGGTPERPNEVETASLVEPRAKLYACLVCDGGVRVRAHDVREQDGHLVREVWLRCVDCAAERAVFFRVVAPALN